MLFTQILLFNTMIGERCHYRVCQRIPETNGESYCSRHKCETDGCHGQHHYNHSVRYGKRVCYDCYREFVTYKCNYEGCNAEVWDARTVTHDKEYGISGLV